MEMMWKPIVKFTFRRWTLVGNRWLGVCRLFKGARDDLRSGYSLQTIGLDGVED